MVAIAACYVYRQQVRTPGLRSLNTYTPYFMFYKSIEKSQLAQVCIGSAFLCL